jgi:hypothetical protein
LVLEGGYLFSGGFLIDVFRGQAVIGDDLDAVRAGFEEAGVYSVGPGLAFFGLYYHSTRGNGGEEQGVARQDAELADLGAGGECRGGLVHRAPSRGHHFDSQRVRHLTRSSWPRPWLCTMCNIVHWGAQ